VWPVLSLNIITVSRPNMRVPEFRFKKDIDNKVVRRFGMHPDCVIRLCPHLCCLHQLCDYVYSPTNTQTT